jgi:hypothetical protein
MPAAALAIPSIIGAAGSIGGALIGSRAANKAGQQQQEGARRAGQLVTDAAGQVNPGISSAAAGAGQGYSVAAGNAGAGVSNAAAGANGYLRPYYDMGTGAAGQMTDFMQGDGNKNFTAADMEAYDPGYQFRIDQAMKSLNNGATAHGMTDSGAALKSAAMYSQNLASDEFGKAFDRFNTNANNRFTRLSSLMGYGLGAGQQMGQNDMHAAEYGGDASMRAAQYGGDAGMWAAGKMGDNTMGAAKYAGDAAMGGANAQAAGTMGSANAWSSGISGAANSIGQGVSLAMMRPKITAPTTQQLQNLPARPQPMALSPFAGSPYYSGPGKNYSAGVR